MARLKPCPDEGRSLSSPACGRQVREDIGMARLTRRYKVGCSEPASESGRYMRVGHRGNHKGARDSPRPLHLRRREKQIPPCAGRAQKTCAGKNGLLRFGMTSFFRAGNGTVETVP